MEASEFKLLKDKWLAIFHPNPSDRSEGVIVLREPDRSIAAYENLIDLQDRLLIIIPKTDDNARIDSGYIRRHISLRHIPKDLDCLS